MREVGEYFPLPTDAFSYVKKHRQYAAAGETVCVVSISFSVFKDQVLILERADGFRFPYVEMDSFKVQPIMPIDPLPVKKQKSRSAPIIEKKQKSRSAPIIEKKQSTLF